MSKLRARSVANPKPAQIRAAREDAGLTQTEAAALIHSTMRTWQDWEGGQRRMHPAFWELFTIHAWRARGLIPGDQQTGDVVLV